MSTFSYRGHDKRKVISITKWSFFVLKVFSQGPPHPLNNIRPHHAPRDGDGARASLPMGNLLIDKFKKTFPMRRSFYLCED
jgi:hypothetical protein